MRIGQLTFAEFLDSRILWEDALRRSIEYDIFLTWEWLSSWWKHFGNGRQMHLFTIMDKGRIVAAAPLMSFKHNALGFGLRKMIFLATPQSDYHTFLLTAGNPEYARAMIEYAHLEAFEWDWIELCEIPSDSRTASILSVLSKEFGFHERAQGVSPYLKLPTAFEDFFQRLSPKFRSNLRRCERNLKKEHRLDFKICGDTAEIKDSMQIFFDLHEKRWHSKENPGALSLQRTRDFHLDVALSFAERGWLTLIFITLDDVPVASIYGFTYGQKLYAYLSGFDPEYSKYSVGDLSFMYLIKHCIESGLKEFDFMRGAEPYKYKWNTMTRSNLQVWAVKPRLLPIVVNWFTKSNTFSLFTRTRIFDNLKRNAENPMYA